MPARARGDGVVGDLDYFVGRAFDKARAGAVLEAAMKHRKAGSFLIMAFLGAFLGRFQTFFELDLFFPPDNTAPAG